MNISNILIPVISLAIIGAIFGIILSIASKVFAVKVDDRVVAVRNVLPGANCGACGYPGCDGCAQAMVNGSASVTACVIGGKDIAEKVAEVMELNVGNIDRNVACVLCQGDCHKAKNKFNYHGYVDCRLISDFQKGEKACSYGCVGGGTCVSVCEFDSIHMFDGVAKVDKEKCVACMKCIEICPKKIIDLIPYKSKTVVECFSNDIAKVVRADCSIGCIACKLCEKNCPKDAIHVNDNLAKIDYSKCINCGICAAVCPTSAIYVEYPERVEKLKQKRKEMAEKKKQEQLEAKKLKEESTNKNNNEEIKI